MEFDIDNLISTDKNKIEDKLKAKGGRPKIVNTKNKRVTVYFTEKEYEILSSNAKDQSSSVSQHLRSIILPTVNNSK